MYLLGLLCFVSATAALPTVTLEQLRTNLPALQPPQKKNTALVKDQSSDEQDQDFSLSAIEEPDKSDESKIPSKSAEKPEAETAEDIDIPEDVIVIPRESKESKESKDSKEISKESKESKEFKEPWQSKESKESKEVRVSKEVEGHYEIGPLQEPEEEKKEKDSKSGESKEVDEVERPTIIQVIKKPSIKDWLPNWFPDIHLPWLFSSKLRNTDQKDQPIYIVRESDFDLD